MFIYVIVGMEQIMDPLSLCLADCSLLRYVLKASILPGFVEDVVTLIHKVYIGNVDIPGLTCIDKPSKLFM